MNSKTENLSDHFELSEKCPVTGLPVYSRPEWIDVELDKNYSATFKFIGKQIILTVPCGEASEKGIKNFFKIRNEIIDIFIGPECRYFELKDYSRIKERHKKADRDAFVKGMKACQDRLLGFICFNAPFSIRLAFIVGKRLFNSSFPAYAEQDYSSAILSAVREIDSQTSKTDALLITTAEKTRVKKKNRLDRPIQEYIDELVKNIGSINWEIEGLDDDWNIAPDHPFKPVFDALSLIKFDIDNSLTERMQMEEELRISEESLRRAFSNAPVGIALTTPDGRLVEVNKKSCEILGYSPKDLIGLNLNDITYSRIDNSKIEQFESLKAGDIEMFSFEDRFIRKDGKIIWARVNVSQSHDPRNEKANNIAVIEDITGQKEAELRLIQYKEHLEEMVDERTKELSAAKAKAEEASRSKSHFLANMSHEIRTPLNGIIGMAELAEDTVIDNSQKQIFSTMALEANSLLNIVNTVLDFSKIEAGKLELEEIPFDLMLLMENMIRVTGSRAEKKGLEFIWRISPDVPKYLMGDPSRLRQILSNLLSNALKFTREGEISVLVDLEKDHGEVVVLKFSIRDTGVGIPKEKQDTIFESFTQADGSTARKFGGTGLGTNIAKQLTELMGGTIGVESEENEGSVFWFTALFRKQTDEIKKLCHDKKSPEKESLVEKGVKVDPEILVVEDYITNQQVAMGHLKNVGYNPDLAENGLEAVEAFKKKQYDLVIMDIQMPVMGGFEAVKEIRKIETNFKEENQTRVPIIAMTAHAIKGYKDICINEGMDDYISKPLKKLEFLSIVNKWLRDTSNIPADSGEIKSGSSTISNKLVTTGMSSKSKPIDYDRALFEFEGDKELLNSVLKGYVSEVRKQVEKINQAIAEGNSDIIKNEAHSIKGGAANLTAEDLTNLALAIEVAGQNKDFTGISKALEKFEKEFVEFEKYVRSFEYD